MSALAVVSFSGGAQSFVAAQRAVAKFGAASVALLFADTSAEDADLYRFVVQGAALLTRLLRSICGMDDTDTTPEARDG